MAGKLIRLTATEQFKRDAATGTTAKRAARIRKANRRRIIRYYRSLFAAEEPARLAIFGLAKAKDVRDMLGGREHKGKAYKAVWVAFGRNLKRVWIHFHTWDGHVVGYKIREETTTPILPQDRPLE